MQLSNLNEHALNENFSGITIPNAKLKLLEVIGDGMYVHK